MLWVALVLFIVGESQAQIPGIGPCPNLETVPNFNVTKFLGKWYEQAKYLTLFQLGGKCVTADYTLNENGTVNVFNSQLSSDNAPTTIEGTARFAGASDEAKLIVNFPSTPVNVDAPYWVIDTDYDQWAVVWSCVDILIANAQFAWILTRESQPAQSVIDQAYAVVDENEISRSFFVTTSHENCTSGY